MKRALIITLLIAFALWLAGCTVVETHHVRRRPAFHAPPPVVVYRPVPPPHVHHHVRPGPRW